MSNITSGIPSSGPGSGTVTSISAGTGITLTPNPITTVGSVALTVPVTVPLGGTGFITATTAYAPIVAGTTPTGAFQVASTGLATVGSVLTSTGSASVPTWQVPAGAGVTSITGNSGGALTGALTFTGGTTGLLFSGAGTTETLTGTLVIANGGTNATSMATSTGIVKYDGTRLVTSSTALIDSSNRMTNSSQPCFIASQLADQTNVTGDGTAYTVTFTNEILDQGNNFNGTSTFTAPVTGTYFFSTTLLLGGLLLANDLGFIEIVVAGTSAATYRLSEGNFFAGSTVGTYSLTGSTLVRMTSGDTATVVITIFDGLKVVDIFGETNAGVRSPLFSGYLVC